MKDPIETGDRATATNTTLPDFKKFTLLNPTDSVTSDGTKVYTQCNGQIDSRGLCSKCGKDSQTSSSYCGRLIEVKPTETQDELWNDMLIVYHVDGYVEAKKRFIISRKAPDQF